MMCLRFAFACFLFLVAGVTLGPTSLEFHRWYGAPILERFSARPGINVTVEYGTDRLACEVRISPALSLVQEERFQATLRGEHGRVPLAEEMFRRMPLPDVTELVEQIAPAAMRGKSFGVGATQSSCGAIEFDDYEDVRISRVVDLYQPEQKSVGNVSISFKRDLCPKLEPPAMQFQGVK